MVDQQPPRRATLTLGPKALPPLEKPPPEPPNPPFPPQNSEANGPENPLQNMPVEAPGKKQERTCVTSLDEAHAPFRYLVRTNLDYNGTFTDAEDPKQLFNNSAQLIISTLQGGPLAPAEPTPDLLGAADWADLASALLAAIGQGYSLQYDRDQADPTLRKEWDEAPDPSPLGVKYPTLFHRLSATADALNDQLLIDCQGDACTIDGWIAEAKMAILHEETQIIKAQIKTDWHKWQADEIDSRAAAQEKEITEAVQKRNASYFLSAAAELGLRPPPTTSAPTHAPRGIKRTATSPARSTEPVTPRKQKTNPLRETKNAPTAATPRGRTANHPAVPTQRPDPSPTPQPRKKDSPAPRAVLNLSPKVTLNLGTPVSTVMAPGAGQLDAATITAAIHAAVGPAIHQAMAPLSLRIAALERSSMPPPAAKVSHHPLSSEQPTQYGGAPPQPNPTTQTEGNFTMVSHTGKGRGAKGKAKVAVPASEQTRQAAPTPTSYAGAASTATNLPQPPPLKKNATSPPIITEVTVLRAGGLTDTHRELQIRNRAADAIVREVRLKMAKATANPIRLRAGRWSISPRSKGNFVFSFDGNVPFDIIKSYEHILLSPLGDAGVLCPSMGWTRFLANGVPVHDNDDLPFGPGALLEEVRTLPGMKKVFFAMHPRWLTHPERIYTPYSSITFAISDPDGSLSSTLINNRAALFGKEVTIRKWIDKPAFIQCSRCHALGHNKASRVCTLSNDSVRCHVCGSAHPSEDHDTRCPKKHAVVGICDCKRKCLNCHNFGHDCRDPRCPARDQFRPRPARKPRKGKGKEKPLELEDNPCHGWDDAHWDMEDEWNDEVPGQRLRARPQEPPQASAALPPLEAPRTQPLPPPPVSTLASPEGPQTMNIDIDYDFVDPLTNRPDVYDDPFAGGETPAPVYSPSRPQEAATPLAHD
jgi:hypothetical protein